MDPGVSVLSHMITKSAGEWRKAGLSVPEHVPDEAELQFDDFRPSTVTVEGQRMECLIELTNPRWEWLTAKIRFTGPAGSE